MLLDTSGLLSLYDEGDEFHDRSVRLYEDARRALTHDYVLAEFIPLVRSRGLPVERAIALVLEFLSSRKVETFFVDRQALQAALALLTRRPDKGYSVCDAVSFQLMRELGINEALTTDRHFEQEGFVRLLKG